VVDAAGCSSPRWIGSKKAEPVCLLGLKLHILDAGATFNLHTRQASAGSLSKTKD
jgi:cyanophycinase